MRNKTSWAALSIALALAFPASVAGADGAGSVPGTASAAASALLAVDQNRSTIVERIVGDWSGGLAASNTGLNADQLREMLFSMRADQLLAASLAGTLDGLRDVVAQALVAPSGPKAAGVVRAQSSVRPQALGDPGTDVVYVPVTPCRLVETRTSFAAVYQGGGPFAANEIRTYTVQGGAGVCLSQLPGGLNPAAVQLQVFGIPQNGVSGDIEVLPQGSAFGTSATLVFLGNLPFTSAGTTSRINQANNQISVQVRTGIAHVAIDVVGYFRAPAGGYVASVAAGTGITVGGTAANPMVGVAGGYQLPQGCSNGQVPKSNGTGSWTCAPDDTGGGGGVTSLSQGTGITLTPNPITSTGTVAVNTAVVQARVTGSCAPGTYVRAIATDGTVTCGVDSGGAANAFVQGGNAFGATAVLGTTDNNAIDVQANGVRVARYEPNAVSPNVIAGHPLNSASPGVRGATIAGGGVAPGSDPDFNFEDPNRVTAIYGTIGGGYGHLASGQFATVAGGLASVASGFTSVVAGGDRSTAGGNFSVVGGGQNNNAAETFSIVGGGFQNNAIGPFAVIPGGRQNTAAGSYSFAAGRRAKTESPTLVPYDGTFVWADANDFDFNATANNEFAARTTGGVRFVLGVDAGGAPTWTCSVVSGGSWACSSDRNLKQDLKKLDGQSVLSKLLAMPIYAWSPKGDNAHLRHFGPTAQDFYAAFGLGDSELRIGQQDADGVALAAIQGLNAKLDAREAEIGRLRVRAAAQQRELAELRRSIDVLMSRTSPDGKLVNAR